MNGCLRVAARWAARMACVGMLAGCALPAEYYPLCNLRTCLDDPSRCAVTRDDLQAVSGLIGHDVRAVTPEILRNTDNFVLIRATEWEHRQLRDYWQAIACVTDGNQVLATDADRYWKCISSVPTWVRITNSGKLGSLFLDRNYRLACLRSVDLRTGKPKVDSAPKETAPKETPAKETPAAPAN
jgi:hypothetical protein